MSLKLAKFLQFVQLTKYGELFLDFKAVFSLDFFCQRICNGSRRYGLYVSKNCFSHSLVFSDISKDVIDTLIVSFKVLGEECKMKGL